MIIQKELNSTLDAMKQLAKQENASKQIYTLTRKERIALKKEAKKNRHAMKKSSVTPEKHATSELRKNSGNGNLKSEASPQLVKYDQSIANLTEDQKVSH
jgi:hypothetical protein